MLTKYQKSNFRKNKEVYKIFKVVVWERRKNRVSDNFIIEFFNMINRKKINIISQISDEFVNNLPYLYVKRIITEILVMEEYEINRLFVSKNGINLNREVNSIKQFVYDISKYNKHLMKYPYSLLELYAKHVGIKF
ncbi:MAG: hypothetical protein E7311_02085 [Clostridiales bacterium]|nr:hypothetical protein [Clostridiales bacterium]